MIRITAVKRLMAATDRVGPSLGRANSSQIDSIRRRLETGKDVHGNSFAPYKDPSRYSSPRPLAHAARLFEETSFSLESGTTGNRAVASISGLPARIAYYQNKYREFLGYSSEDRRDAVSEIGKSIMGAVKNWR